MRRSLTSSLRHLLLALRGLDLLEFGRHLSYYVSREKLGRDTEYARTPPGAAFPVWLRRGSSDHLVYAQIFVLREYLPLKRLGDAEVIVDAGANVGYSAVYFLNAFPRCRVIAIEPDPDNFRMLSKNLAPYGDRALSIRAAIWPENGHVVLAPGAYRDGREWSRQVMDSPAGSGSVEAITLASLFQAHGLERVSLLKMDIEGAEVRVLGDGADQWLSRIDALAVELHDDSQFGPATPVLTRLMAGRPFEVTRSGELTICRRLAAAPRGGRS